MTTARATSLQDSTIGKKVYRITGSIPASCYVKLPGGKPLSLSGRFAYIQVCAAGQLAVAAMVAGAAGGQAAVVAGAAGGSGGRG